MIEKPPRSIFVASEFDGSRIGSPVDPEQNETALDFRQAQVSKGRAVCITFAINLTHGNWRMEAAEQNRDIPGILGTAQDCGRSGGIDLHHTVLSENQFRAIRGRQG